MSSSKNNYNTVSGLVRKSTNAVTKNSAVVNICDIAINKFTAIRKPSTKHWLTNYSWFNNITGIDYLLEIMFAFNSLSFCYWGEPKWSVRLGGKIVDGSQLLLMCLLEQVNKDSNSLKPESIANYRYSDFIEMLKGASKLKLVKERYSLLKSLGELVCDRYSGSYLKILNESDGTAQGLLKQLVNNFPGFEDVSEYNNIKVHYYKRAQLLVSDVNHCLIKEGLEGLSGTNTLTACADYKLPQMLRMFGVLKYNNFLVNKIGALEEIEEGSLEENELRSATVVAVEKIKESYHKSGESVNSISISDDLWILSQSMSKETWPYHRVLTTKY